MGKWPRISIVTPSYNQGTFIAETIESVVSQKYPDFEHIIIDGGSTDETLEVLKHYPYLRIVSEPDRGQADAINKGFQMATGKILGYLNSDDTLVPRALHRVAREIDFKCDRHIVMGRCRFIDERGRFIGTEHPSHFENHRRVLEVWKGHLIPQPAVFWSRKVWERCGGMDENLKSQWIDYDLFCRFSRKFRFYWVNQVLATYRLHSESKTEQSSIQHRLEESIRISKRYWGSPLRWQYWRLSLSLGIYRFNRTGRARRLFFNAKEEWRRGDWVRSIPYGLKAGMLAPEVAFYVGLYPTLKEHTHVWLRKFLIPLVRTGEIDPRTKVYLEHVEAWDDGWAGPHLVVSREAGHSAQSLFVQGTVDLKYMNASLVLTLYVDGRAVGERRMEHSGDFRFELPLSPPVLPGQHTIEVQASTWFVPHRFTRNSDFRPLAWRFIGIEFL